MVTREENRDHKRRWIARVGFAVLAAMALVSCSTGASPTTQSGTGVTNVTFWGDWGGQGEIQFKTMAEAFNSAHPNIKVSYVVTQDMLTKFVTAATSGNSPDVMFWDRWRTALYGPKNILEPIDSYMSRDNVDRNLFYSEALRELSYKDKLYGLPITVDARALFYNKKQFADAGISPPRTWDELEAAAVKLTQRSGGKLVRSGFALNDPGLFNMYLQQAGGQMVSPDCSKTTFNNNSGKQVLQFWKKLMSDGVYETGFEASLGKGTDAFVTGKESMLFTGPWNISSYQKYGKDLDFGIVPPPSGPGGQASIMGGFGLVIPKGSKHKDAAWEFVKWWTANANSSLIWATTSQNIPGNKETINSPYFQSSEFWKPVLDTLNFSKIRPTCVGYSPMETDALIPNLQLFLEGKQSVDDTLNKAQTEGDRILAQYNK
jgi:multiple sugar transport system substrate-binding protein